MRIVLPSNETIWVSLRHEVPVRTVATVFRHEDSCDCPTCGRYSPDNSLPVVPVAISEVEARCHPNDQFSKRVGRRLVADRVLAEMRTYGFSKEDRKVVFEKLCPEFGEQS